MNKLKYLLISSFVFMILISPIYAITIRETTNKNDKYSTIEEGTVIIGVTKFTPETIVTASKAATAGVNDVMLYLSKNGSNNGYEMPGVYYYVDEYVGWFFIDSDNKATPVENTKKIEKLNSIDIYYINNIEKKV